NLAVESVVLSHNTAIVVEPQPALRLLPGARIELRNNIFVVLNGAPGLEVMSGEVSDELLLEGNAFWGFEKVTNALTEPAAWSAQLRDPGLVDATGPALAQGSAMLTAAQAHASGGSFDLVGAARPSGGT